MAGSLKVLVIITATKRAVIHQLKRDMYRYTIVLRQNIPSVLNMLEHTFELRQPRHSFVARPANA